MIKNLIPLSLVVPFLIGCGGGGSDGKGDIDLASYLPSEGMSKSYLLTVDNGTDTHRETYEETIEVQNQQWTYQKEGQVIKRILILADEIQLTEGNLSLQSQRFVDLGDTLFTHEYDAKVEEISANGAVFGTQTTQATKRCKADEQLTKLESYSIPYTGDILKIKCTEEKTIITKVKEDLPDFVHLEDGEVKSDNDISYIYLQAGLGIIAKINDNCFIKDKEENIKIDDTAGECEYKTYTHTFFLN